MDKIIIITDHSEADVTLIQCLGALFPDCEIQIQQKASQGACEQQVGLNPTPIDHSNHSLK